MSLPKQDSLLEWTDPGSSNLSASSLRRAGVTRSTKLGRLRATTSSQPQAGRTADTTSPAPASLPADRPPGNFVITFKDEREVENAPAVELRPYGDYVAPADPKNRTPGRWDYSSLMCRHGPIDPATLGTSAVLLTKREFLELPGNPGARGAVDDDNLCTTCAYEDFVRCKGMVKEAEKIAEENGVNNFCPIVDLVE